MKPNWTVIVMLALASVGAGCVGSGPNTQQGAVGGALAGAVVGGVIGNNRGSGNVASGAAIGATAGGLAGATIGNSVDHQRGTIYGSSPSPYDQPQYDPRATYQVQPAPPPQVVYAPPAPAYAVVEQPPLPPAPPREIVTIRPAREAVWVHGYHLYLGRGRYEWVPGHWEVPPGRYSRFEQPRWERRPHGYVYVRGYWR